jgi:hypothetical protein
VGLSEEYLAQQVFVVLRHVVIGLIVNAMASASLLLPAIGCWGFA